MGNVSHSDSGVNAEFIFRTTEDFPRFVNFIRNQITCGGGIVGEGVHVPELHVGWCKIDVFGPYAVFPAHEIPREMWIDFAAGEVAEIIDRGMCHADA